MKRARSILALVATSMFAVALPRPALAQSSGVATTDDAVRHFEAGRTLVRERRYAEAIPEFLASMDKERTVGGLLNVADCYERVGKYATAWARFREAAALAATRGDDRHKVATAAALDLERRLPSLTVRILPPESELESLAVLVDGEPLAREAWNRATPVDPGEHFVLASAAGKRKLEARVVVTKKGDELVVRLVDEDAPLASTSPPTSRTQRTLGIVGVAAGGALVVAGGVAALIAMGTRQEVRDRCPDYPACTVADSGERKALEALNARGQREALLATIGVIAGAAVAGTGIALIVSSPRGGGGGQGAMLTLERHF